MANVRYLEGDWFAVPLSDGGFAVGVIARANPSGVLLGYFFGPRRKTVPAIDEMGRLSARDAVLIGAFGHLGLARGTWPLLGRLDSWDRGAWPMPVFIRYEELTGRTFKVFYDDANPNRVLREERVAPGERTNGPQDGLMGPGFVEIRLTRLLRTSN